MKSKTKNSIKMKQNVQTDGTSQGAQTIADNDCKIYYAVSLEIIHSDENGKCNQVAYSETIFKEKQPLESRRKAFEYAVKLAKDAETDGKLCQGHLDSPFDACLKRNKDINSLSINVNLYTDGEEEPITICEGNPIAPIYDELAALADEYQQYREYGYDTGGQPHIVLDENGDDYRIINLANNESSDSIYCVDWLEDLVDIKKNGVKAEEDGYILFLTTKDIADNYVLNQCLYGGEYALIEVSTRGITAPIESYNVAEFAAYSQRLIKQDMIKPEFIKSIQITNSLDKNFYIDYYQRLFMMLPHLDINNPTDKMNNSL